MPSLSEPCDSDGDMTVAQPSNSVLFLAIKKKLDHMTAFGEREKGSVRKAAKKTSIGGHSV